jgi:hypothetical protein
MSPLEGGLHRLRERYMTQQIDAIARSTEIQLSQSPAQASSSSVLIPRQSLSKRDANGRQHEGEVNHGHHAHDLNVLQR